MSDAPLRMQLFAPAGDVQHKLFARTIPVQGTGYDLMTGIRDTAAFPLAKCNCLNTVRLKYEAVIIVHLS